MSKTDNINSKIIALTKSIYFNHPSTGHSSEEHFFPRKRGQSFIDSPISIVWWLGKGIKRILLDLSSLIIDSHSSLVNIDKDAISDEILESIKEILKNADYFDFDKIFFSKANTLFEARSIECVPDFANSLKGLFTENISGLMDEFLLIAPLYSVEESSTHLFNSKYRIIESQSAGTWASLAERYHLQFWDPFGGKLTTIKDRSLFQTPVSYWFSCEVTATEKGSIQASFMESKILIALLHSVMFTTNPQCLTKSMDPGNHWFLRFSRKTQGVTSFSGQLLFPSSISPFRITSRDASVMDTWFSRFNSAEKLKRERAVVSAQFVHSGVLNDGIDRFIHFFIALDALFGSRRNEEHSIRDGIISVFGNSHDFVKKFPWLYDLRCEIIHGGSANSEGWGRNERYYRHFESRPIDDIVELTVTAFMRYFE